jgi:plasmid stabilization system protein ParE
VSFTLIFAREALDTYESIQSQILDRWGETVLDKFERKTLKTLDQISKSLFIFKETAENPNVRKELINKNCSVFYEVKTEKIEVLFFWDNRQEPLL